MSNSIKKLPYKGTRTIMVISAYARQLGGLGNWPCLGPRFTSLAISTNLKYAPPAVEGVTNTANTSDKILLELEIKRRHFLELSMKHHNLSVTLGHHDRGGDDRRYGCTRVTTGG